MGHIFIAGKGVKLGDPDFQSVVYVINFNRYKPMCIEWESFRTDGWTDKHACWFSNVNYSVFIY